MSTRRTFLRSAAAAAASGLFKPGALKAAQNPAGGGSRPNILIFMPDQQQGQTVLPGYPTITPNLDKFAKEGLLFTNAFCPAPHCCPSRASFQTGLYPSEHGIFNNVYTNTAIHANPYPGTKFISQYLKSSGYQVALSGKWHVARDLTPQDVGYKVLMETGYDVAYSGQKIPGGLAAFWGNDPPMRAQAVAQLKSRAPRRPGEVIRPGWGNAELIDTTAAGAPNEDIRIVQAGVEGIKNLAAAGKPWCLFVSNGGSHDPYRAPKKFVDMYDWKSIELPLNFRDTLEDKPRVYERMRYQYWSQLSDDEIRQMIAHYWACATMEDALFGELLAELERTGQADNTIVLYTSDHGDYAAAHGLWCKGIPSFREGYNIPCVMRWPRGLANPGRQLDAFVSTTDFAPTFLEAAGIPSSEYAQMSGHSLMPWLRGETPSDWRDAIFTQMNGVEVYYTQRIVMTKDYKYVYNDFDYDEMYDLKNDPYEMVNLAFPDVKMKRARMEERRGLEYPADVPWPPLPAPLEEARLDLLRKIWVFAAKHKDTIFDPYYTVALAPYGPAVML